MTTINVVNREGSVTGQVELNEELFAAQINVPLMHQAVRVYLANRRRGTHSSKNRAAVAGGGKKPWRQKGTGRASFGSSRNPVWRGGGVAFGPVPHDHNITMPRKMRRLALYSALTSKVVEDDLIILDELDFNAPKTKEMARVLANLEAGSALLVLSDEAENTFLSAGNIPGVKAVSYNSVNTYDVLYHQKLILTQDALAKFEGVYENA